MIKKKITIVGAGYVGMSLAVLQKVISLMDRCNITSIKIVYGDGYFCVRSRYSEYVVNRMRNHRSKYSAFASKNYLIVCSVRQYSTINYSFYVISMW